MAATASTFIIKSYSKMELVHAYGVSLKTFKAWLSQAPELGEYKGKRYTPAQVLKIVYHLGTPTI
jgi:hypothetical protein